MGKKTGNAAKKKGARRPRIQVIADRIEALVARVVKLGLEGSDFHSVLRDAQTAVGKLVSDGYAPPTKTAERSVVEEGDAVRIAEKFRANYPKNVANSACEIASVTESGEKKNKRTILALRCGSDLVVNVPRSHVVKVQPQP